MNDGVGAMINECASLTIVEMPGREGATEVCYKSRQGWKLNKINVLAEAGTKND